MPKGVYIRTKPKSKKQIEASRKNGRKAALSRKGKPDPRQAYPHGRRIFPNTMAKHHNDLCHGAERPDDITYMTFKKHGKLHADLQVKNGTHNLLAVNRAI